jgi:hypothetical protein
MKFAGRLRLYSAVEYLLPVGVRGCQNRFFQSSVAIAARERADAAWRERVANTPIGDAEWEAELRWRREWEDEDAHPERFIHRV